MMTIDKKWEWLEEAKKLGYTLASEEREREFRIAQTYPEGRELSAED